MKELVPTFGARALPKSLPRREYAPVAAEVRGMIQTTDATHPSALREAEVDVDGNVKLNVRGYPVCRSQAEYDIRPSPSTALKICHDSLLGRGTAWIEIALPGQKPTVIESPLWIFNGGEREGEAKLLTDMFVTVPAPSMVVIETTIARDGSRLHTVSRVPVIAGGSGSLIGFRLRLGKTYSYKGKKVGYFEARCPESVFNVDVFEMLFKNEAHTPGVAPTTTLKGGLAVPCTPKG